MPTLNMNVVSPQTIHNGIDILWIGTRRAFVRIELDAAAIKCAAHHNTRNITELHIFVSESPIACPTLYQDTFVIDYQRVLIERPWITSGYKNDNS